MFFSKKKAILVGLLLVVLFTALSLIKSGLTTSVQVSPVKKGTAIDAVPAIVNVRSEYAMTLSSEEAGRVAKSSLELGKQVSEGDLILTIDSTDLEIDARILKADIANLEAQLALNTEKETERTKRKEDLENYERLYRTGNYPELEMVRRRRELAVFEESQELLKLNETQQLNTLKGELEKIERRLAKTKIYAPTDGIVTEIYAYPGELVSAGSSLANLFSKSIVVEAKINEEDFAGIKPGMDATVRLLTYGNQLYDAKVYRVLPTADKENQQYTVFLELDILPEMLIPGLSGEASIIRQKIPDALIIPRRALMGDFVFVAENGQAIFKPVEIGVRGLNMVEIIEGLEVGQQVVTDGMAGLKDGTAIQTTD